MGLDAKAGFAGLVTATAEATGQPSGLRVADNVVLRKEGALMPRPVFASTALSRAYAAAFPYAGALFYVGTDNRVYSPAQVAMYVNAAAATSYPAAVRADIASAVESRGNLYFPSVTGVHKITSAAATSLSRTGLVAHAAAVTAYPDTSGAGPFLLAANQHVAYRAVGSYTDANGVIIRSRPTGAFVCATGASPANPTVEVDISIPTTPVDTVEVYRSRVFPTTAQIDDELQLVKTLKLADFGIYVGTSFTDRVADTARGMTLYTSPSRGGMENAAERPPGAACVARFRGSLFFGNIRGPQRVVFSHKRGAASATGSAAGLGWRAATANSTNGGFNITSVSNTTGIQIGAYVAAPPSYGVGWAGTVTAIAGTTITLSIAAPVTQSGGTYYFGDAVSIDGGTGLLVAHAVSGGGLIQQTTSRGIANDVYQAYEVTPPNPGYDFTVVVERIERGTAPFQMRATRGNEYSPPLALGNAATGTVSTSDVIPNGLAWSEPDEPEHAPPKNTARVGDAGKAILALVSTKDRLLIFKEDGLFMLVGDTARNFAIYPLDTTCLCILPGSVRRLKNTVYALTNLGIIAVDDGGGVEVVSRPIQLEVAVIVNAIRAAHKSTGLYNMPGLSGITGAGDDAQGEYHLALGSSTPSFGGQVLVYSIPRDGYTTFSFGTPAPVALATDGEGQPLVLTASSLLTPTTALGTIAARVSPRAFSDPALVGKFWSHIVAGFSVLTGTTNVQAKFTSSAAQVDTSITEAFDLPLLGGAVQFPLGSLLRHPVPSAVRRAYLLFVELLINVSTGTFTLETIAAESRENIPNKKPTHGSGAT